MDEQNRKEAAASLLKDMEATAAQMRAIIVSMPPLDLLGYIYAQRFMAAALDQEVSKHLPEADGLDNPIDDIQFLLEYVHAVLASDAAPANVTFDEAQCVELFELCRRLREQAIFFAMATSPDAKEGVFGPDTAEIEFHAKATWVMIRGNRYQVLEGEFYRYVLAPHDDVLQEVYGAGAADIAEGFQAIADATRSGHSDAIEEIAMQAEAASAFSAAQGRPLGEVMEAWLAANAEQSKAGREAVDDMLRGGIANMSRHTKLPQLLLADLAYQRGEEVEFFAPGAFSGTPYRTLPARKKPLIQLGLDYYAIDPYFVRDAGYRALLFNLLQRKPDYKKTFEERQKTMSESAFADILSAQLPGATIFQEVYYKDPTNKQWSENDTLILIDDVLFLVEAKAGAAATIASPALDFDRHARAVQDLVLKAYTQCERFFSYLSSAEEVPLYQLIDGKYVECGRVRSSDYRVMVPIGLTVESFSPFSTYCKELPQVEPLLGKYAFVSLSIDDLLVLKRFLPTPGSFAHYMEVRQAVAGMRGVRLFDEFDHLGAYLMKNRFDWDIADQLKGGKASMLIWNGMSDIIDNTFKGEDWESRPFPAQEFPEEVLKLLRALDAIRAPGWLSAESYIRDLGQEGRNNLAKLLSDLRQTLNTYPARYFALSGENRPLFIWLQRCNHHLDWVELTEKARAAALAARSSDIVVILVEVGEDGGYRGAKPVSIRVPRVRTKGNAHIYEDAARMADPARVLNFNLAGHPSSSGKTKKPGRNDQCLCGSGAKYKKCHGR